MLFDVCASCQRCCHVFPEELPLPISLTHIEKKKFGSLCIKEKCRHLSATGCVKKEKKPFSCKLYPLSFDPVSEKFSYDVECPLMPAYIDQLAEPSSEAQRHLRLMKNEIKNLRKSDAKFLQENHAVDSAYFSLRKLPRQ